MSSILEVVLFRSAAMWWLFGMGIASSGVVVAILLISAFAFAQSHAVITSGQLVWKPLSPGVEMAIVSGDPDKKGGLYVIRSKGEVKVPPHWHPTDEHVTVLAGSFLMARGDKYDASKLIGLKAGAHSVMPATVPHFGLHKAGNVVEVYGEGPLCPDFRQSGRRPEQS